MSLDTYNTMYHFYHKDFTSYHEVLKQFRSGELVRIDDKGVSLCEILNSIDEENDSIWNVDSLRTDWSLAGARVKYNGPNRRCKSKEMHYKNIMVFVLNNTITPKGRFVLHYDDPLKK